AARVADRFRLDPDRVVVIHNGVDPKIFSPAARNGRMRTELPQRYVASIGSYLPRKGHRLLLEAFSAIAAEFPDTSLVIAGMAGPEHRFLLERAAQLGLADRLACFVGLTHADTASLLAGAEVCVQPAYAEPFGLAIIEAGACGVPVAASAVSGHTELLKDGDTGFLFPAGDQAACVALLRQLLYDRESATRAAGRFRAEVLQEFGWRDCAQAYFALNVAAAPTVHRSESLEGSAAR
ncbi:MAG: glycosyltransferase family 1 protein, partial [Burkholderiales bacterium]